MEGTPDDRFRSRKDIRVRREPAAYRLGRQTVNDSESDRFLTDHGVT
jgi:hypothetical protein